MSDFTPEQQLAIDRRGSSLLVSAAAGSGKTRVLTSRLLSYVTAPVNPVDVDRFLVITYTKAAAAELRDRIMGMLSEKASENPADSRLRRQQNLCCRASIGTIHSFCTQILREYSQQLGLSPAFAVMEDDRASRMKLSVVSRLLDRHYEHCGDEPEFLLLADTVGAGANDAPLQDTLLKLHDKLRSHPYPEDWAAEQKAALNADGITDAGETAWGEELMRSAKYTVDYWIAAMEDAIAEMRGADDGGKIWKNYGTRFEPAAAQLRDLSRALGEENWDRAREFVNVEFPRLAGLRGYPDPELQVRTKSVWDGAKDARKDLAAAFAQDSAAFLKDLRAAAPAMCALLDLALEFDRDYTAEKQRRSLLDFSDLEHYAARLLVDKATGAPTWVAAELSQRYHEIMVDEYQDVNEVQELIFRAVSRQEKNLFLVGDVKQSIYRFRLAEPRLFLEKYRDFIPAESAQPGDSMRILLQKNFRSRKPILDAANLVMRSIMSEELGELDYDEDAALKYGAVDAYDPALDVPAEFHIIDTAAEDTDGDSDDGDDASAGDAELEARFIADKILSMMREGTPVTVKDGTRPCNWGDFVLLMLSPKAKGKVFHRVLEEAGIPVESRQGGGFYSSLEVSATVDLLAVIDNPHADVPLISALRSPAFGFTADELTAIRTADPNSDFYTALCRAAETGNERCAAFLRKLNGWRALAPEVGLDTLIWQICSDAGLFAICSAMRDGTRRRQNLMRLFELAHNFDENGYRGLFRFVQWLRRMAEAGTEPDCGSAGPAVRILTIHKSKGLEFPFVFLCDLGHRFNTDDLKKRVLIHAKLGLGPRVIDAARGIHYPTMAFQAVKHRLTTEMLSEEMRVLYVAMTRAKERLYMSCAWKTPRKKLDAFLPLLRDPLPPETLRSNANFAKWIAMSALLDPATLPIVIHGPGEFAEGHTTDRAEPPAATADAAETLSLLRERLDYAYSWAGSVDLPSKLTATELKRLMEPEEDAFSAAPVPDAEFSFRRPDPAAPRKKLSAAQRGTATHAFLEYVDFAKAGSADGLKEEARRMEASGLLKPEEIAAIDFASLERFFASGLGQRLRAAKAPRREFRFLLLEDAEHYFPAAAGSGDELMMQGVVDCCFEEDGGITVLDYKTDRVTAEQVPDRAALYRPQLQTYAKALERIFGLPVRHGILWFLHTGTEYEVEL